MAVLTAMVTRTKFGSLAIMENGSCWKRIAMPVAGVSTARAKSGVKAGFYQRILSNQTKINKAVNKIWTLWLETP